MAKRIGYIGSLFMLAFSFTLYVPFAITGLALLTVQTIKLKAHNMTALNIVSIIGFIYQLFS